MSVRESTLDCLRPGGLALTEQGINVCNFPLGAVLADIGCGNGSSVRYLHSLGYVAHGVDLIAEPPLLQGDATCLPFATQTIDGLLYECSFSKMFPPEMVLAESKRVLKPQGKLLMSDFYARGLSADFQGLLGRVEREEEIKQRLQNAGFQLLHWQDASHDVLQTFGQLILNHGCVEKILGANRNQLRQAKSGYFLSVWEAS